MKIDYSMFQAILATMTEGSKAFELVRTEMQKRGRWKNKPRGKAFTPADGGFAQKDLTNGGDAKPVIHRPDTDVKPRKRVNVPVKSSIRGLAKEIKPDAEEDLSLDDLEKW